MVRDARRLVLPLPRGYLQELRQWARSWISERHVEVDAEAVVLAMTEMVTNSLRHATGPVGVELARHSRVLLLSVSDLSEAMPRQPGTGPNFEGRRGMLLVATVASRWGVQRQLGGGKSVWCEFTAQPLIPETSGANPATG